MATPKPKSPPAKPKKKYVKPKLKTHGSVEKLTETIHRSGSGEVDCGSGIRFPSPGGNSRPGGPAGDW